MQPHGVPSGGDGRSNAWARSLWRAPSILQLSTSLSAPMAMQSCCPNTIAAAVRDCDFAWLGGSAIRSGDGPMSSVTVESTD